MTLLYWYPWPSKKKEEEKRYEGKQKFQTDFSRYAQPILNFRKI